MQQKHPQCSNHSQHPRSQQSQKIIIKGGEDQKNALRKGDVGIKKIYGQLRREDRDALIQKARLAPPIVQLPHNDQLKQSGNANVQLYHSDFRLLTEQQIPPETVDLIFTEPPDDGDSLSMYQDLAKFGNRWLKEGASLVTYAGQWALPTIFDNMKYNNLQFWWIMSVEHTAGSARMHKYRVRVRWKPLLWFVKGPVGTQPSSMSNDIHDFIVSRPPEDNKLIHKWEQSTLEASYIIEKLSVEHQLVVDPFLGYGSTGVAAVKLNRRFVGSDISQDYCTTAADRISRTRTTAGDRSR
jgi:DNA methylase